MESIKRGDDAGEELSLMDLPPLLLDQLILENNNLASRLTPLLEPTEVQLASMLKPNLQLRGTLALLERQKSLKRCRHLIQAWSGQRLKTLETCIASLIEQEQNQPDQIYEMETQIDEMFKELNSDALNFQSLYYSERKHIKFLDQQRCAIAPDNEMISA